MNEPRRIIVLQIGAIVTGRAYTHMVQEAMGMGQVFTELFVGHTLGLKMRFEQGDFGFLQEVRRIGAAFAVAKRPIVLSRHTAGI